MTLRVIIQDAIDILLFALYNIITRYGRVELSCKLWLGIDNNTLHLD